MYTPIQLHARMHTQNTTKQNGQMVNGRRNCAFSFGALLQLPPTQWCCENEWKKAVVRCQITNIVVHIHDTT